MPGLDIIADVHGMLGTWRAMLAALGWHRTGHVWRHPDGRRIVQLGDLIDRGPDSLGCVELMEELVRDGVADHILGNHEVNALGWFVGARRHTETNRRQFAGTLAQIEADPPRWERASAFLKSQPLVFERDGLRFVHAAWVGAAVAALPANLANDDDLRETRRGGRHEVAVENALKGPEEPCAPFLDQNGTSRRRRRVRWWENYPADAPPVFFGHYWFTGTPRPLGPGGNAICLDYSCGRFGPLVAYRWPEGHFVVQRNLDGEP